MIESLKRRFPVIVVAIAPGKGQEDYKEWIEYGGTAFDYPKAIYLMSTAHFDLLHAKESALVPVDDEGFEEAFEEDDDEDEREWWQDA